LIDLTAELAIAIEATRAAGLEVARMRAEGLRYGHKDGHELVSEADVRANEMLHEALRKPFPDVGWLSEEHTDTSDRLGRERVWIVDPIDGTREFLQGIPEYAVSVGLVINGEPALGVVYNPAADDLRAAICLGAEEGLGLEKMPRRVNVLVGRGEQRFDELPPIPAWAKTHGVGSVAYRLALIANGTGHAVLSGYGRSEWDVAAGVALCLAAGMRVTDILSRPLTFNKVEPVVHGMLIAQPAIHERFSEHFKPYIG
jgi:myo-inositol-1(or 4)-monophosphatase